MAAFSVVQNTFSIGLSPAFSVLVETYRRAMAPFHQILAAFWSMVGVPVLPLWYTDLFVISAVTIMASARLVIEKENLKFFDTLFVTIAAGSATLIASAFLIGIPWLLLTLFVAILDVDRPSKTITRDQLIDSRISARRTLMAFAGVILFVVANSALAELSSRS